MYKEAQEIAYIVLTYSASISMLMVTTAFWYSMFTEYLMLKAFNEKPIVKEDATLNG